MSTRFSARGIFLAILTAAPLVAAISLGVRGSLGHRLSLDEICVLAQAQRFDEAEARGAEYLRLFPYDSNALLVMAELALARPSPDPDRALERLGRVRADSPAMAAWLLVNLGNAYYLLARFDRCEALWTEALARDSMVREARRRLLDLFTLQGRAPESRRLVLGGINDQTAPEERLQLLLRLARLEVDPPDPWMIINRFEPAVRRGSADLPTALAYGLTLTLVSRSQQGLPILRAAVARHPEDPAAWDALLSGLEVAKDDAALTDEFSRLPDALRNDPRFAKHEGRLDQMAGRWSEAVRAYRRAWEFEPENTVGYRLRRALDFAGQKADADRFDQTLREYRIAFQQVRALLAPIDAALRDGQRPPGAILERMADWRERMGRREEASAWRRLLISGSASSGAREFSPPSPRPAG
jgi:tetratricopeptide (TPR) repeat protein